MQVTRVTRAAVDFSRIYSSLGLGKETIAALQSFRKRNEDAKRVLSQLQEQKTDVDIAHYRSILKNKAVVDEAERTLKEFKAVTYDVKAVEKAIDAFEAKAVEAAVSTEKKIDAELKDLQATLANIEQARPFDQLTTDEVAQARPQMVKSIGEMLKKGKWTVPGYKEKFGDLNLM